MTIARHTIDMAHPQRLFKRCCGDIGKFIDNARQAADPSNPLAIIADSCLRSGAVVAPDSADVALALRVSAQAHAAMIMFAEIHNPPRYIHLGDGPSVTYTVPVDVSYVTPHPWHLAYLVANITRDREVLDFLAKVPGLYFRNYPTPCGESAYDIVDMYRASLLGRPITEEPAFHRYESGINAVVQERSTEAKAVRLLTLNYLRVLKAIDASHQREFHEALTESLLDHKKYWSATEKRRQTPEGWVSIKLTSAAAMAYDRGLKVDVESDYLPMSWIGGDHFRNG